MRWVEAVEKKEAAAAAAAMVLILGFFFLRIAIPVLCVKCRNHPPFGYYRCHTKLVCIII
ncbi:hypothetical protein HanXRQr2_Chr12g0543871 [Helianthus annuus]|uniref:Uncharacterized protein n=1 Tax=Helianthus annuus TaxID=4232 RepID=A0A9K3MW96_HELAN|nr:hypothetical protein HanXRQr2_Chr12g0543871 [Helianthus annuus]